MERQHVDGRVPPAWTGFRRQTAGRQKEDNLERHREYKNYKAVFFDWDGTAVLSRKAPAGEAAAAMKPLLHRGVKLVIVSGTTIENIAGGGIAQYFTEKELENLYLGLGRGAFNYGFQKGEPYVFQDRLPDAACLEKIHRICFEIHTALKQKYDFDTDIVFSRPNYCKIDLMPEAFRGDNLFMQENELDLLKGKLRSHGSGGGLKGLMELAIRIGAQYGLAVKPTCDAKYLEVGISSKSDNVDAILKKIQEDREQKMRGAVSPAEDKVISAKDCAFWGDEFVGIEEGIFGSDSFMMTELTKEGDFFDVSMVSGARPEGVVHCGGGVERFLEFLLALAEA